jgi:hypothetical protein
MESAGKGKKKTYFFPTLTKLTPEQTISFIRERTSLSNEEALNLLASLRRQREEKRERQPALNRSNGNHMRSA